jgi:hypothetical protein
LENDDKREKEKHCSQPLCLASSLSLHLTPLPLTKRPERKNRRVEKRK